MDVNIQQEQHIIIKCLVVEGVSGAEIHCRLLAVFKSETLSRSRVFEWCTRFRSGHQSVGNDGRAGVPHSAVMAVNMACVFWDSQGVILVNFVPSGSTVNADYYSTLHSDQLRGLPSVKSDQICYGKASHCSMIMLHHRRLVRQRRLPYRMGIATTSSLQPRVRAPSNF